MKLKRLILISRPMMWPWTVLMYMVGIGNFSNFSIISVIELLLFSFPINLYLYGLNDIYDFPSDALNERKKDGMQGATIKKEEEKYLKRILWMPPVIFILISLSSLNLQHIVLSMIAMILPLTYSHPKFIRTKEILFLDCLNSAIGYCIPALVSFSLHGNIADISFNTFFIVFPFMGIHALTTLVDIEVDKKAGMKTTGIILGKKRTTIFLIITFAIAAGMLWNVILLRSMFSVVVLLSIIFLVTKNQKDEELFLFLASTVMISFMMLGMFFFIFQSNQ